MYFADFGERLCDIVKKYKHPCLTSWWSMFTSHTAYNVWALYVFPGLHFIAASLLYLLSHETISFGRRHTCISVASSKVLALKLSDSIFGQNNFPCF